MADAVAPLNIEEVLARVESELADATAAGEVVNRVVEAKVEARLARRAELLEWGFDTRKDIAKQIAGIVPATVGFKLDGTEVKSETYSKCQVDSLNRLNKNLGELDAAIGAQDFDKLSEIQRKGFAADRQGCCQR